MTVIFGLLILAICFPTLMILGLELMWNFDGRKRWQEFCLRWNVNPQPNLRIWWERDEPNGLIGRIIRLERWIKRLFKR